MTITSSTSGVNDGSTSNDSNISLTFTSSENTNNFVVGDITISNGSLSNFSGSNKTYTATFTPTTDGDCTIKIIANKFTDTAGNGNTLTDTFNWKYDKTAPLAFTTGSVIATGGTVVTNYWNSTNTGINITVPILNDSTLTGGSVQLLAKVGNGNYENLGSSYTIQSSDINTSKTLSINANTFEAINNGLSNNDLVYITSKLTDAADNTTTGTQSSTTITIDQAVPADFTVGSVVTTGGTVVANYWNSTNTGIDITVPVANDSTLTGGSIQLRAKVGSDNYENLGSLYTIVSDDLDDNKTISITNTVFEAISSGLADGEVVTINAIIKDKAGNATTGTQSSTTITVDQTVPSAFTVGNVVTTGVTVVANYWNSTNTGIDITVPVANDSTLTGGSIQLRAKVGNADYEDLGSLYTIVSGDLGENKTLSNTALVFEALSSGLADGEVVTITAIIKDKAGNSTTGTQSSTTITVDQTDPSAFTVGSVVTTGGTVVANYWNSTNTGIDITVPVANDSTLTGGSIQLRAKVGNADYENLGSLYTIVSGDLDKNKTLSVTNTVFEAISSGLADGEVVTITAIIKDKAGNATTGTQSSTTITVDQTVPSAFTVGTVVTKGVTVVANYWNSTNTGIDITVPVANDSTLTGGSIQLRAKVGNDSYEDLGSLYTIVSDDLDDNKTISITNTVFEAISSGLADGEVVTINAIIKDKAGNATTGTQSSTTITVDQTVPSVFTVGSVVTKGVTVVANYWNSTNTGIDITVPVANDSTLTGGSIQLRAKVGTADYEDLGSLYTIVSGDLGENKTLSNTAAVFEALSSGLADGEVVTILQ